MEQKTSAKAKSGIVFLLMIFIAGIYSCEFRKEDKIKIAVSKSWGSAHYVQYEQWLKSIDPSFEYVNLYGLEYDEAIEELKQCYGIVLSGGPDVAPGVYGDPLDSVRCGIDYMRDTLEFKIIEYALNKTKMPILGICRGEQILNVYLGGTLVVDIPTDFDTTITHRCEDPADCFHEVAIAEGSMLNKISNVTGGTVNTNHHQAVERLADGLKVTSRSIDGLVEAYEWINPCMKPYMMAVQWHPERMEQSNPLSRPIGVSFINAVKKYFKLRENCCSKSCK